MAKKLKNAEMLVAEIHFQQSKLRTLRAQFAANEAKINRLAATNNDIKAKATRLQDVLNANMTRAQQNGIPF